MIQSIRNIDAFTLGLGLKVGQDLRGRRKTKKEMRNGMQCNGMKQSGTGCRCTMRREREREEPFLGVLLEVVVVMVVVWRSWLLFLFFSFRVGMM